MLTNDEIIELEELLNKREIDNMRIGLTIDNGGSWNPNYNYLNQAITSQLYDEHQKLLGGFRGCLLEGSSRSGKTWAGVDIIIWLCLFVETSCTINIYRETYNEFKTTLYDDFKRRLDDYGLPNPFHKNQEVKSFKIGKNTIYFLGDGKHGGGCDYAFFNEMMHIKQSVFDQVEMRCRKFWWGDYNPSFTEHWVFDKISHRPDVGFLRTTFLNNLSHISVGEKNKILSYEPWKPGSYIVLDSEIFCLNKNTGKVEPISKTNIPLPHPTNISNGTADEFMWKVYGLGLRGAMKGVIFNYVEWIDEFPEMAYIYTNDFGFTTDPNAFNKYAEDTYNIWIEPLVYSPIETSEELAEVYKTLGVKPNSDEFKKDGDIIICDSSDKYTGENKGTVEMVKSLKKLGYNAKKVSKTKSVIFHLNSMKSKKIHIVKNHLYAEVKKEKENYKMKEVGGMAINQPNDAFNHFWDSARYGHMEYNTPTRTLKTDQDTINSINY